MLVQTRAGTGADQHLAMKALFRVSLFQIGRPTGLFQRAALDRHETEGQKPFDTGEILVAAVLRLILPLAAKLGVQRLDTREAVRLSTRAIAAAFANQRIDHGEFLGVLQFAAFAQADVFPWRRSA